MPSLPRGFPAIAACLLLLAAAPASGARDGKAAADETVRTILERGLVVTVPPFEQLKTLIEAEGADVATLTVPVSLQATDAARTALESAARELDGVVLDAVLELDYGIVSVSARSVRISRDPALLEYFQRRIGALLLRLDFQLEGGGAYACTTGNPWRIPVAPVSTLFAYGGRPSIQGLGLSSSYDGRDDGFVAARSDTIKVNFKAMIPQADMARVKAVAARVVEGTGDEPEGACRRVTP